MKTDNLKRSQAIRLRTLGFSYGEIGKRIKVSKSTLSLWLRTIELTPGQRQRLKEKKVAFALKGAMKRKEVRLSTTREIKSRAVSAVGTLTDRELWLIGIALYWAEGAKEKEKHPSQNLIFSNSDPSMVVVFLKWLRKTLQISEDRIIPEIYLHESHRYRKKDVIKYWSNTTGLSEGLFTRLYYKKNSRKKTLRSNTGGGYFGLLRIRVARSTNLNRTVSGWIGGVSKNCGVV